MALKTWKDFLEGKGCNIEDVEEKLGKDLDGDNEKGEPEDHKKKVFGKTFGKKVEPKEEEEEEEEIEED